MGNDISADYANEKETYEVGVWDVRGAVSNVTKQRVSFWKLNYEKLKSFCKDKKTRKRYISYLKERLDMQSKIENKFILKIYQVSDASKNLSFSAEPILFTFTSNYEKTSRDETIAIGLQLANALETCHSKLNFANIGISPETVVVSTNFQTKLLLFQNAVSSVSQNSLISQPFSVDILSSLSYKPKYMSQELRNRSNCITRSSDIYSYGVFLHDLFTDFNADLSIKDEIPDEFLSLIDSCVSSDVSKRPTPHSIIESEAYSSLVSDVFIYLNKIIFTDEKDRYSFFEGLLELVEAFSTRIFLHMFMPIFVDQMDKDKRFCLVILPIIYKFIPSLNEEESTNVIQRISFLFNITRPPQIIETTLDNMSILLEKVKTVDVLLQALFAALKSEDTELMKRAIAVTSVFKDKMEVREIQDNAVMCILGILEKTMSPAVAASIISSISIFAEKVPIEFLFSIIIPALLNVWMRTEWLLIAEPICEVLSKFKGPPSLMMKSSAALATMMLGNENIDAEIQIKLINVLSYSITELRKIREFLAVDNKEESVSAPSSPSRKKPMRSIRPTSARFNPFDSAVTPRLSNEGELIASCSKGEINLDQVNELEAEQQISKSTPQINFIHRRSGSGPAKASVSFSAFKQPPFAENGNLSETPCSFNALPNFLSNDAPETSRLALRKPFRPPIQGSVEELSSQPLSQSSTPPSSQSLQVQPRQGQNVPQVHFNEYISDSFGPSSQDFGKYNNKRASLQTNSEALFFNFNQQQIPITQKQIASSQATIPIPQPQELPTIKEDDFADFDFED